MKNWDREAKTTVFFLQLVQGAPNSNNITRILETSKTMPLKLFKLLKASIVILFLVTLFCEFFPRLISVQKGKGNIRLDPVSQNPETFPTIIPLSDSVRVRSSAEAKVRLIFSFKDFQRGLCRKKNTFFKTKYEPAKGPCPKQGIASVVTGARTGNLMWDYASVWAVARRTGLKPYLASCSLKKLEALFEALTVPSFDEIAHCPVEHNVFVGTIEEWTSIDQNILLPRYTLQPELVLVWAEDIRKEFTFKEKYRKKAQTTLKGSIKNLPPNDYTFIAVHVRRTDYVKYLKKKYNISPVDPQFFINAMAYYKNKYPNCIFIYISDDPKWCSKKFGNINDVFIASENGENTATEDLALMAACNHTIFDYGTFGEWGSLLAGGKTIYKNMTQNVRKGTWRTMKNWILMD